MTTRQTRQPRPGRTRTADTSAPAAMRRVVALVAGGAVGVAGIWTGLAQSHNLEPGVVLVLCVSTSVCAVMSCVVSVTTTIVNRSPEARRMAALHGLARRADSAAERRTAMAILTLNREVWHGAEGDAALVRAILAEQAGWPPHVGHRHIDLVPDPTEPRSAPGTGPTAA